MTLVVKWLKLNRVATIPQYAYDHDAGCDLQSIEEVVLAPGQCKAISTGLAMQLPVGYEAQIRPRSGLAKNYGVTVMNSPGTIDAGYTAEIKVLLINHSNDWFEVRHGMRIAQLVIAECPRLEFIEVAALCPTDRGSGGFGSTGT